MSFCLHSSSGLASVGLEKVNDTITDVLTSDDSGGPFEEAGFVEKIVDEPEKVAVSFSLEYFGLRESDYHLVKEKPRAPPTSRKLLKCHSMCEQGASHRQKHKCDISSSLGQIITQLDVIDEAYKKVKLDKVESYCIEAAPKVTKKKHRRGRLPVYENPILEEIQNCTREYSFQFIK